MQSRLTLVRDLILIPVPFCLLAVGFFVAGVQEAGILMVACAAAGAVYVIRPQSRKLRSEDETITPLPEQSPPAGTGGGGPV